MIIERAGIEATGGYVEGIKYEKVYRTLKKKNIALAKAIGKIQPKLKKTNTRSSLGSSKLNSSGSSSRMSLSSQGSSRSRKKKKKKIKSLKKSKFMNSNASLKKFKNV
ncbi:unnamed protein product [Moneuplotes crassus]|uniref:Uncharacterized protein n=1 Tax=Euplotes crassus TaxID=5936 RepID=A0AAD1XU45_EUPCR|nr:unnamed protein product [Moneuplotes crassus]